MKTIATFPAIIMLLILLILPMMLDAQHQNVVIAPSINYGLPTEPAVMMNPFNPDEILVGGMPDNSYYSIDGGYTWTHENLQSPYGVNADPVILADNSGKFFYLHLPDVIKRVVCHRKDSIAGPWNMESTAAYDGIHDVDKEWASYDPVTGNIYLSWTYFDTWGSSNPQDSTCIYSALSNDGGMSWSQPVRISKQKGNATGGVYSAHGSYNTTGPGGEVYICWFGPSGLMFDRSYDQGATWLADDINASGAHINWIYSIPGVNLGVTFPVIACDRSGGPSNGNIYISWADKRNGSNDADVFIVRSTDGGATWSPPIRVNDDPPGHHQFFPFLTVDQVTGKVWLVFFDRRNYTDNNTDVYMAVSEDGGTSFTNFKVSETSFIPFNTVFFGHYVGLTACNDHVFPVWNRMDNGENSLIGAIVDPTIIGQEELYKVPEARIWNYPNPFKESTFVSFRLQDDCAVTIQLFDITGKLINTLADKQSYARGKHVLRVDPAALGLTSGAYLVRLTTDTDLITTRIILFD